MSDRRSSEDGTNNNGADIPHDVRLFLRNLHRRFNARSSDLQYVDAEFNKTTERWFPRSAWPTAEAVSSIVEDDENFLLFYKELYFRHVHARLSPSVEDRFDSFQNYTELFNLLLGLDAQQPEFEIPGVWLWEIVDEFVSQFQAFHQLRAKVKGISAEDVQLLKDHENVWSPQTVTHYLLALVKFAGLEKTKVATEANDADSDDDDGVESPDEKSKALKDDTGIAPMFKTLGYFALVGLLRINCLLGDYVGGLRVLDPLDLLHNRSVFTRVMSCHISLYHHLSFAYLMTRRYMDCTKTISSFLLYISRSFSRAQQQERLLRRVEQILGVLAMSVSLCPQTLDDAIQTELRDKFGDSLAKMQRGDTAAFEEVFALSQPGFISPAVPNYDDVEDNKTEAVSRLQLKVFLSEVAQRANLTDISAYLKLCTNVNTKKLAALLSTDEDTLATWLLTLKHKTRNLRWRGGPPAKGEWVSSAEVDFSVNKDVVHVSQTASARRFGDFFIRNIVKFEHLIAEIRRD